MSALTPIATEIGTCPHVRFVPIAVVSGLLNSKKLLRCTFGDNLERHPKCWIGALRVGGIVHVRQHCASFPLYGLIERTSSSVPFRFSSVENQHADEAQACRRRRVFERRPIWAKGATRLPSHESGDLRRRQ
jgi:hypothetical protein